ncbi:hypothetical protein, partial [Leucobacter musarum]|uniref:hypothetical protein n=1 Tax=Leucobacter musarum TaxID=1930747 RepID=UPI001955736A
GRDAKRRLGANDGASISEVKGEEGRKRREERRKGRRRKREKEKEIKNHESTTDSGRVRGERK